MTGISWWVPLGAALLGGILATVGNVSMELVRRHHEQRALALAFRGELLSILKIIGIRKYEYHLLAAIDELQRGATLNMSPLSINGKYFRVYEENASRLGLLPPAIAEKVAASYTYANSFIEDATNPRSLEIKPEMAPMVEETLYVLQCAVSEAKGAVELIEHEFLKVSR